MKKHALHGADAFKERITPSLSSVHVIAFDRYFLSVRGILVRSCGLIALFLIFSFKVGYTQSAGPSVVGVSGGQATSGQVYVTWTVGEVAVGHHYALNGEGSITEGVHQPYLQVEPLRNNHSFDALIFPNPVTSEVTLRLPLTGQELVSAHLVDGQGRILQEKKNLPGGDTRFDLRQLPVGVYYLHLGQTKDASRLESYKIIKVNR